MLDSLITSKTRIKLLLKFFSNSNSTAYLRSLADEFNESTNSVRLELNSMTKAGLLTSKENGRTIEYQANKKHPLFPEINNLVLKHFGLYNIAENVVKRLGNVELAFVTGDYANGIDGGIIDLVLIGDIDRVALDGMIHKVEKKINRRIRPLILSNDEFDSLKATLQPDKALVLWKG
ncbi:MAG: ArsR family transcriptional regulator [Candidatus Cyclobacteriaceae bacterium M2_1C_046]